MRYIPGILILTLLLIAIPSINSARSSLQQELSIQNMGNILYQDNFGDTIFFQYGAESGQLQPPWDIADPHGGPISFPPLGSATIDDTQVRTGSHAVKLWQGDPPKLDGDRRVVLREYIGTSEKDIYLSFWCYFPDISAWKLNDSNGWGHFIGGIRYAVDLGEWHFGGVAIGITLGRNIQFSYANPLNTGDNQQYDTGIDIGNYLDQWVHFQVHLKFTMDATGVVECWFQDNKEWEKTNIVTDPEADPDFGAVGGYCGLPHVACALYGDKNGVAIWNWVDDIVASREKVPETYGADN